MIRANDDFIIFENLRAQVQELQSENEHLKSKVVDFITCQTLQMQVTKLKSENEDLKLSVEKLTKAREIVETTLRERDEMVFAQCEKIRLLEEQCEPFYEYQYDDDSQAEDQPYAEDASPTAESPGYIADSNLMEDDTDADSIDYPDEPGTNDEDEDLEEDVSEEHEPENEDAKEDESSEDSDETEPFEENETAATPPPPRSTQTRISFSQTRLRRAWKTVRLETPMPTSMEVRIAEHAVAPIPPTNPTYDQAPLGHRAAMIRMRDDIPEEDMPPRRRFILTAPPLRCDVAESSGAAAARAPRGQYDFVEAIEAGQGLIHSPGHDVRTIARAADKADDVGYVRALQTFEHRMTTSIEEVNLRVSYQAQVRRQEMRGQRTAYETEVHKVRQAYLSSEARYRALLVQLKTLETHMSRMEWQRQRAEDDAVRQIIIMPVTRQGTNDAMTPESIQAMIDRAIQRNSTHMQDDASHNLGGGLRRHVQPARVCSYPNFIKCQPLNFKGTECIVGLSQWIEKMESVFHINGCAIENQVKFATYTLLGVALTWWDGHMRTLGHDAAYAMTWGTFKKKLTDKYYPNSEIKKLGIELWNLKVMGNDVAAYTQRFQELALIPKTLDFAIELANDLMDQKLRTYAERQNENKRKADDSPIWRLPLLHQFILHSPMDNVTLSVEIAENRGNGNGNGTTQGRAYALGGRDASPNSNVITGTFLLNNRYAKIWFDIGAEDRALYLYFSALIDITPIH
ncbi:putative reverse transcriptase domain-containing protein [Tanacetum coccineum]